jgi:hypothetical protein
MQRTLAVILGIAGLVIVGLGAVISAADGAAIKYGAMLGGIVLAVVGVALYRSTIEPEPFKRRRDYKETGKLDLDGGGGSGAAKAASGSEDEEPKPSKSKRIEL